MYVICGFPFVSSFVTGLDGPAGPPPHMPPPLPPPLPTRVCWIEYSLMMHRRVSTSWRDYLRKSQQRSSSNLYVPEQLH